MSESPKMGLFGSKDETKETKKDTKDGSPDRYAPYCIDSDSETYDTEALSIMDINDIIGVQSEPVSDSTLESEIAALSQMITESKTETSHNAIEKKSETEEKDESGNEENLMMENSDIIGVSGINKHSKSGLGEAEKSCKEDPMFNSENKLQEPKKHDESHVLMDSISSIDSKCIENSNVKFVECASISIPETSETVRNEENVNRYKVSEQEGSDIKVTAVNNKVTIIEKENSIRGSLQLIGEAYSSEDSQEASLNEEEAKESNSSVSNSETCLISCEEKKQDVNNILEKVDSIDLDKAPIDKNVTAEVTKNKELYSTETDLSSSCTGPTHAEEFFAISEETKDVPNDECKIESPSNNVSQHEEKNVSIDDATDEDTSGEISEKNIDTEAIEEIIPVQHSELLADIKHDESVDDTCIEEEEKSELEVADEGAKIKRNQETTVPLVVEEETTPDTENKETSEESKDQVNTLEIKNDTVVDDQTLNTEQNNKEISEKESEVKEPVLSEVQSDSSAADKLEQFHPLQVADNSQASQNKSNEVEFPEVKENMEIEKLELVDAELQQDSLQPICSQLSSETNDKASVVSEETSVLVLQESTEPPLDNDNLTRSTVDVVDNLESNTEIEDKESNNINSMSSEIINESINELKEVVNTESVDATELLVIQEKPEVEMKIMSPESSDVVDKSEVPMEVNLNEHSTISEVKEDTTPNLVNSVDISATEDNIDQPLEEGIDKTTQEMKVNVAETVEVENCNPEKEESQESTEIEKTAVEEAEPESIVDEEAERESTVIEEAEAESLVVEEAEPESTVVEEAKPESTVVEEAEPESTVVEDTEPESTVVEETEPESIMVEETEPKGIMVEEAESEKPLDLVDDVNENAESKDIEIPEQHEDIKVEEEVEEDVTMDKPAEEKEEIVGKRIVEENKIEEETEENEEENKIEAEAEETEEENRIEAEAEETEKENRIQVEAEENEEENKIEAEEDGEENRIETEAEENEEENRIETEAEENGEEIRIEAEAEQNMEEDRTKERVEENEEENRIEEEAEKDEKDCSSKVIVAEQQLMETTDEINESEDHKDVHNIVEKDGPKESIEDVGEEVEAAGIKEEQETDVKEEEAAVYANEEDAASNLKFINKNAFSPLGLTEVIVPEEDAKEEHMEEEMKLTLEPEEETDSQPEMVKSDVEEKSENENDLGISEEIVKENQEDQEDVVKMDDTEESFAVEKSEDAEAMKSYDAEEMELNKNEEEISDKQESEDNDSKSGGNKDSFNKDILQTANNVDEIFSGEQCQNTQDIVTSILDDVRSATDFKNILNAEASVTNEIEEVLEQAENLPLEETEIEQLTEKLPRDSEDILNNDMEDTISTQNMDSLEGLLGLNLMPEGEDSTALKEMKTEEELEKPEQQLSKVVGMGLLLEESNHTSDITQSSDYMTDVISSFTDRDSAALQSSTEKSDAIETVDDKSKETEPGDGDILKVDETIIPDSTDKDENVEELQKDLRENTDLPENELEMDFEDTPLDTLEETESKLELASDILLNNEAVDQGENMNDAPSGVETSQPSSEISELESAVKFLQESEEQAMDSPLVLSPKMVESVVNDISKQAVASSLFVGDEDMCENTSELEAELQSIGTDSISISEAEIISEAAKLESERKLAEQIKIDTLQDKFVASDDKETTNDDTIERKITVAESSETKFEEVPLENIEAQQAANLESKEITETVVNLPQNVLKTSETIPKVSILEERLKEPPKIEIPATDVTKVSISPTTSKDSLLIQKDAKLIAYQKMLESPKLSADKSEPKIVETPRKDSEKHDFENVGSPRIILKIAKSAITDCGEPRSPKSPKIRSATNSPNPEDSPGQKLGKIKLKLSKGGHPSIISNENVEDVGQWHSEGASSLSPIGMKIKLSKTGDASIVCSEKHESIDDSKESKHKFEEMKRTESPIGMKIKLSKSGDASIVQQDCKEMQIKHKEKLDMVQGSPKRTESPIGMKIKLSKSGDASIIQPERQDPPDEYKDNAQIKSKEKLDSCYGSPKRTDSPIGMKIKLSKSGDASIVSPDLPEECKEICKGKEKLEASPDVPKRTESPIGMKIKLAKTKGGASIISVENSEEPKEKLEIPDIPKRTESPLGMKIKLSKTGDASIVHSELLDDVKEKAEAAQDAPKSLEPPCGMKIKVIKSGDTPHVETITEASADESGENAIAQETLSKLESPIGMKIKLSKFGDASIVPSEKQDQSEESKLLQEAPKRTESPLGMKIKLSKTGDASIIQPEHSEDTNKTARTTEPEHSKPTDSSLGMKIKLLKTGDASIVDPEKKDRQLRRRETESPLEMKIKLSKTGHATIVACDNQSEAAYKAKEVADTSQNFAPRYKEPALPVHKEPALKILKTSHSTILQSNRSELTIEPVQMQGKKPENVMEISPKRKDITISPIESKKSKLEAQFTQILPEVTIQPVTSREQKQFLFDPKNSAISLQQMNVINQEISITQVRPQKPTEASSISEKLKDILSKNVTGSPINSDCEIIEHRPELIIVNENSNSSQDVVIIEEVPPNRMPEVKVPKKRGRPRRNPLPQGIVNPPPHLLMPRDPLSLDDVHQMQQPPVPHFPESRENERPKRTCRNQKSYAPPRRGRGRGRGKRKLDSTDPQLAKKLKVEQDLNAIEASTTAVIPMEESRAQQESFAKSPELYKVLKQPTMDSKVANPPGKADKKTAAGQKTDGTKNAASVVNNTIADTTAMQSGTDKASEMRLPKPVSNDVKDSIKDKKSAETVAERIEKSPAKVEAESRSDKMTENAKTENKDMLVPPGHPNWLTPASKRAAESAAKSNENVSTVQVIDEETRMSAESGSRSQTPARNISVPASETIVNEESQGSVLSTATTESEKVKVKNRRMEINFDPDEGPFTVDKIAEYEWPIDRKGETFMIQEQISQYLGVKSFKRKYPDLKRRVVDMEERNYLRENGLVSEAMCDMGLTAVCSSEVLDVMCSDFPDQYEEYRKHMREKQVKEHSKKQKELTAAANAEKNRIDLAEMAVQSALSWNVSLNKERRENRKCSLDLQTFTIHVPKKQQKVEAERRIGHYPVALIPGQYTDYYREYTPAELRYYPLNTVLYGPMRPNERKFDSQSEGSQSDSDSDSSSDDSSSSSSEGTQDTEGSQSTMDEVDMEIANQKEEIKLKCKMCLKILNKHSKNEVLIQCGTCNGHVHPSCIDLTLDMVPHIQSYSWQCTDCKTCAQCHDPADEDKMLFCDMCDRGYHIYCVGLRRVPQGRWHCQECAVCANCGSREPGGINSDRNSVAQWQHEYKKGDKNTRVYVSTLCVPCSKLWRKGRYCPHCSRCHTAPRLDLEANLVHCSACDKYLHLETAEIFVFENRVSPFEHHTKGCRLRGDQGSVIRQEKLPV